MDKKDKDKDKVKDKVLTFPIKPPRLANRVLQVTKNEADNSEDPRWVFFLFNEHHLSL